jgi:plasmid stability protein
MNFTIKNMPEALHKAIKDRARANRRSINSEILERLETSLTPERLDPESFIDQVRLIRRRSDLGLSAHETAASLRGGK